MKRNVLLIPFLASVIIFGACAEPETDLLMEEQGSTIESVAQTDGALKNAESSSPEASNSADEIAGSAQMDNGRTIKETYGEGDYTFKIDAAVYVPDAPVQTGDLSAKNIDIERIETYLCDGEKLIQRDVDEDGNNEYISSGSSLDNGQDYDIAFSNISYLPGNALYTNWRFDEYYSGANFTPKNEQQWDSSEETFVDAMKDKTTALFNDLGLEAEVAGATLYKANASPSEDYCSVEMIAQVDGFSLLTPSYMDFYRSYCNIGERGVNSIQFSGLFQTQDSQTVSSLSLDSVLNIVKEGVENQNINTYDAVIDRIELAYIVDEENMVFEPVWCFCSSQMVFGVTLPVLCINAQTGNVALMY